MTTSPSAFSSEHVAVLPRTRHTAATLTAVAREPPCTGRAIACAHHNLLSDLHDPLTLQQLGRARPPPRILLETPPQEVNTLGTELVSAGQLRRVALRNIVHDRPLVVQGCPGPPPGRHLKDHAAEGPDVDGALASLVGTFDDFGGHVHGGAGHGFLLSRETGGGVDKMGVWLKGLVMPGDDLRGAEIDVFDYAVVVEKDV